LCYARAGEPIRVPSDVSDWLTQIIGAAVVAILGGIFAGVYMRFLARRRRRALTAGKSFRFDAALRGNIAPFPRNFRAGWVTVGAGMPTWKPRFSVLRRSIMLPTSAVVERVRPLSGVRENFTINSECQVIVAGAGDVIIELAVLRFDLETALSALASTTGGGWRRADR